MEIDSLDQTHSLIALLSGTSLLLNLGLAIAFLVVAFGIVQPRRPDAGTTLGIAAVVHLIAVLCPSLYALTPLLQLRASSDYKSVIAMNTALQGLGILLHLTWMILLLLAIVALARPQRAAS